MIYNEKKNTLLNFNEFSQLTITKFTGESMKQKIYGNFQKMRAGKKNVAYTDIYEDTPKQN